jgi:uncharacterized protein YdbL (DUF1318 family)
MGTGTDARQQWVFLAYRLPREPSTPRIAVWRKLRRLGVVQLLDGLVTLPLDARAREQLEWLAEEVTEAGGEAWIWLAQAGSAAQERALVAQFQAAIAGEYQAVAAAATAAVDEEPAARRRLLGRLRRELHRIAARDYFPAAERDPAHRAVQLLAATLERQRVSR